MDPDEFIVAVYCLVDDLTEEILGDGRLRERGPDPTLDDREVLTMELVGEFLGIDTDSGILRYFRGHFGEWFPALSGVHRTTFRRQGANLWAAKERLWRRLCSSPEASPAGEEGEILVVDSVPMPACKGARSGRCKILWDVADRGYAPSVGGFFYGVRAHVVVRRPGVIVGTRLAPASTHDLHPARGLLAEAGEGWVFGDRNYRAPGLAEEMKGRGQKPLIPHKMTKTEPRPWPRPLKGKRQRVECVFGQLCGRYNAKKVWARDSWHLMSRWLRKVLSHTIAFVLCRRAGLGPLRFGDLLA